MEHDWYGEDMEQDEVAEIEREVPHERVATKPPE